MKRKKYNQTGVWACPACWNKVVKSYDLEDVWNFGLLNQPEICEHRGLFDERQLKAYGIKLVYFDSQAEYAYALKLKDMEKRGLIRDIIHHPRIELAPDIYYFGGTGSKCISINQKLAKKHPALYCKVHDRLTYKADFQYTDKTGMHLVEVKALSGKGVPFITNPAKFRRKVELLNAVHGIDLEIVTGAIRWRFVGKKLEAIK